MITLWDKKTEQTSWSIKEDCWWIWWWLSWWKIFQNNQSIQRLTVYVRVLKSRFVTHKRDDFYDKEFDEDDERKDRDENYQ